jgi:predicted nucleic acid-binding protein
MKKIFLDANILIDILADKPRTSSKESSELYAYLVQNLDRYKLYTSCDLFTTVYYVLNRVQDKQSVLKSLKVISSIMNVIEFGNEEIDEAIYLMEKDANFSDLEDTIQFVMARKERCDYIITNDQKFYSYEVALLSSAEALDVISKV